MSKIQIKQNSCSYEEFYNFYEKNQYCFTPSLKEQVASFDDYLNKIYKNAEKFEAYDRDNLVGIIAVYMNTAESRKAFITSVLVSSSYHGQGIAFALLNALTSVAISKSFLSIELEVYKDNKVAIHLYEKELFTKVSSSCSKIRMLKLL